MRREPIPGLHKMELDTPALLIDIELMEANIRRMADYLKGTHAALRPHAKTHKTPEIALRQIEAGARGVTCAKLGEAEVMAAAGIKDILVANQIVGEEKIQRLLDLAEHTDIIVAVDSLENVRDLGRAARQRGVKLNVIIEIDVGMKRCGVEPDESALRLAELIIGTPSLEFRGIMGYEGHTVFIEDFEERKIKCREANMRLIQARDLLHAGGIPVEIVSAGGTGTYNITAETPGITEIQAGSYVLMDAKYKGIGLDFECALTVLATVISRPSLDRAVIDVGRKGITDEFGLPLVKGLLRTSGIEVIRGVEVVRLSEEHGKLEVKDPDLDLRVGDKIELIPSHCCTTINLYDKFYCIRNNTLEAVWDIAGRGKMQ